MWPGDSTPPPPPGSAQSILSLMVQDRPFSPRPELSQLPHQSRGPGKDSQSPFTGLSGFLVSFPPPPHHGFNRLSHREHI